MAAERVFGGELGLAARYAQLLSGDAMVRGLIGPREGDRIWDRHLLNSAIVGDLLPPGAAVIDVGSGAGLPGIPVAIRRSDVAMVLLEPLQRRYAFLLEAVAALGLASRVTVVRGRAPDAVADLPFFADYALARAVAPLERLVSWTMPLVRPDGELLALRGERAEQECREAGPGLSAHGAGAPQVVELGADLLGAPVRVVRVPRTAPRRREPQRGTGRRSGGRPPRFT